MRPKWRVFGRLIGLNRLTLPLLAGASLSALWQIQVHSQSWSDDKALLTHFQREVGRLQAKYGSHAASFPQVLVKRLGGLLQVEFPIDHRKCDIFSLLVDVFAFLEHSGVSVAPVVFGEKDDSAIDNPLIAQNDLGSNSKSNAPLGPSLKAFKHGPIQTFKLSFQDKDQRRGSLTVAGEFKADRPGFKLILQKEGPISQQFVDLVSRLLEEAYKPSEAREARKAFVDGLAGLRQTGNTGAPEGSQSEKLTRELREMGLELVLPGQKDLVGAKSWDELGGYERQKRDIEDTILLALTHPDVYDQISRGTRAKFERNRPKTVLFEGPPGTGKTTSAKIIASQVNVPLIYVPAEAVLSKWFGESEKSLATLFEKCAQLGKAIIFIDEVDAIAVSRDSEQLHEVSRRLVSTLLRKLDSFESDNDLLLICATNRKEKLDPALLSRVDLSIKFDLPDHFARREIFKRYAKHLPEPDLDRLAKASEGLSGRGILETCKDVERRWASLTIREEAGSALPDAESYASSLQDRIRNRLF